MYLETLAQFAPGKKDDLIPVVKELFKKSNELIPIKLSLDKFRFMSEWYYVTIIEALSLKKVYRSPVDFYGLFGTTITEEQIKKALELLQSLELIAFVDGKYTRVEGKPHYIEPAMISHAVRQFHSQMLELGQKAIYDIPRENRDIRGITLAIKKENYTNVCAILSEAYTKVLEFADLSDADDVYQLSTAFFPLCRNSAPEEELFKSSL